MQEPKRVHAPGVGDAEESVGVASTLAHPAMLAAAAVAVARVAVAGDRAEALQQTP
jgi:hypothetical protein